MDDDTRELRRKYEHENALLAMPIDFDKLCDDGVLEKCGKKKYKVLKQDLVPEHVWKQTRKHPNGVDVKPDGTIVLSFK
ncbi:MAG TPA: hypothetical protein VMM76_18500 [Pirellulaceae bacterium]|nr:hypothetical protein [Pirellulaceae bacterium]